jgi:uncharacterized protein DUF5522
LGNSIKRIIFALMADDFGFSNSRKLDPDDFYYSEQGYIVFTEKYLLKRGYCCQNGCKHCPYGFNKEKGRIEKKK